MDLTADPLIIGLQIVLTGVSVVFLALTVVALMLGLLRRSDVLIAWLRTRRAAPPVTRVMEQPRDVPADQLPPELVVVLAAAAAEILAQPVRVTRVRYHSHVPTDSWSQQGRLTIMASHERRR